MSDQKKEEVITSIKGFDQNWQCRGFQFEMGKTYEHEGKVEACKGGFHAIEGYPLEVFDYYPPAGSKFATVEQSGDLSRESEDSKIASRKITLKAELNFHGLIKAAIEYTFSRANPVDKATPAFSDKENGQASSTGDRGAASSTGDRGAASSTGYRGAASSTGYQGAASSTGDRGAASSTGYQGAASSTGKNSVAMASGYAGRAMGADGCAIFLVYRDDDYNIVHARAAIVGQDDIKAGVYYQLDADGEFVEAVEQ